MDNLGLIIISVVLGIFVIVLFIKNKILNSKLEKNRIPEIGEVRGDKVFISLEDNLYKSSFSPSPIGIAGDKILNQFEADMDIPIAVTFYSVSTNGRFQIKVISSNANGTSVEILWVEPSQHFDEYSVPIDSTSKK